MVGVPRSNRCALCKARKIKCDEGWPACGSCRASGKKCPGPPDNFKFVINGQHRSSSTESSENENQPLKETMEKGSEFSTPEVSSDDASEAQYKTSLVRIKHHLTSAGSAYSKMRILQREHTPPGSLRPSITSPSDRLMTCMASCVDSSRGTGYDIEIAMVNLPQIPQFVPTNVALHDSIQLFLSAWMDLRRGRAIGEALNLRLYNKTIRSLCGMLQNAETSHTSATLAAAIVLTKVEALFDLSKPASSLSHAQGVYWLLKNNGPPDLGDEARANIAFQSFPFTFSKFLVGDLENIYVKPKWSNALKHFTDTANLDPPIMCDVFRLWMRVHKLTEWVRQIRDLVDSVETLGMVNDEVAYELLSEIEELDEELYGWAHDIFQGLFLNQEVTEVADPDSPHGWTYFFKDRSYPNLAFIGVYAMLRITMTRIRQHLHELLCLGDEGLEEKCHEWSRLVWCSIPFSLSMKPLLVTQVSGPMVFSYEAGNPAERTYVIEALREIDNSRNNPLNGWNNDSVLRMSRAHLGRCPMP